MSLRVKFVTTLNSNSTFTPSVCSTTTLKILDNKTVLAIETNWNNQYDPKAGKFVDPLSNLIRLLNLFSINL